MHNFHFMEVSTSVIIIESVNLFPYRTGSERVLVIKAKIFASVSAKLSQETFTHS